MRDTSQAAEAYQTEKEKAEAERILKNLDEYLDEVEDYNDYVDRGNI